MTTGAEAPVVMRESRCPYGHQPELHGLFRLIRSLGAEVEPAQLLHLIHLYCVVRKPAGRLVVLRHSPPGTAVDRADQLYRPYYPFRARPAPAPAPADNIYSLS
ncbi:hypothetical protein D3C80_1938100 [compost metagenome]